MNNNYQYTLECDHCGLNIHIDSSISKKKDWSIFHESIRSLREKGFTYRPCGTIDSCKDKITKQSLVAYDSFKEETI